MGFFIFFEIWIYLKDVYKISIIYIYNIYLYCLKSLFSHDYSFFIIIIFLIFSAEINTHPTVKTTSALFQSLCYENKDRLQAGIIVGGWDPIEKGSLYSIPLGGACIKEKFAIGGSGSSYIYGYCDANFKENMTRDEAIAFVTTGLSHAMARDGSSGGVVRLVIIEEKKVERLFVAGDKLPYQDKMGF